MVQLGCRIISEPPTNNAFQALINTKTLVLSGLCLFQKLEFRGVLMIFDSKPVKIKPFFD